MGTERGARRYEAARVEAICEAARRAASAGVELGRAMPEIVSLTDGDTGLAREALSTCARRSLRRADGWFEAARLLERALATGAFGPCD